MHHFSQGDKFSNGKTNFTLHSIWWKGFNPTRVELVNNDTGVVYEYKYEEFEKAIKEEKIWKK